MHNQQLAPKEFEVLELIQNRPNKHLATMDITEPEVLDICRALLQRKILVFEHRGRWGFEVAKTANNNRSNANQ